MVKLPWAIALACFAALAPTAARANDADDWLNALYRDVAVDLAAGKPLVVQVHVPLCDNNIIRCGRHGLGDGDNPTTNLYWATSGGFKGWFGSARGWKRVHRSSSTSGAILEKIVWRKRFTAGPRWRRLGVEGHFDVYVVAFAWRGSAIAQAIERYVADLFGSAASVVDVGGGISLQAGGAAHVVSYVGHNGWMDLPDYDWARASARSSKRAKATIAVACLSADYLARPIAARRRVPLLMTTSLLFAGAHSFEGAVSAFAKARSLRDIRHAAAENYARGQGKSPGRVRGAFTNPSDRRWQQRYQ